MIGGIVIAVTDTGVAEAFKNFSADPGGAFKATWTAVATAYGALFYGSLGSPREIMEGFRIYQSSGDNAALLKAIYPFTESLVTATPYIFAGLSVALRFPLRPVQYRRGGTVLHGRAGIGLCGLQH